MTSVRNNLMPPGLVSNLEEVLSSKKKKNNDDEENNDKNTNESKEETSESAEPSTSDSNSSKPVVLVTNGDGIDSPGIVYLVEALVREGLYNVHVCAPQSDKSVSGHSVTLRETIAVSSAELNGSTAYEVSGTPVDCVSLALSGALFSWSKPTLVISGINRGSSCGHNMFYSGVVAGAREALISGVPSLSISLNWKKDESKESDFKDAVTVCLPVINAAIRDIEKGIFPKNCSLNVEIPTDPLTNKGFKFTKQSMWRSTPCWQAVSANRHPGSGRFMSNQQILGSQLAQLSRDASAAGAARRLTTQRKNLLEIESVGASGKSDTTRVKKFFRLEFLEKQHEDTDEDMDFRAIESGFVAITPLQLHSHTNSEAEAEAAAAAASDWISTALVADQQQSSSSPS